ncbi:MAG: nucleoside deaminase [Alphaproteobacteria bacterium]|nr:nucleoside deaminase [Alphaproteobacteria bacterium]
MLAVAPSALCWRAMAKRSHAAITNGCNKAIPSPMGKWIGHNQRVQQGDPIAHGEMDALRKAGRQKTYRDTVLYTTLSPCMMCSGTIVQFGIPRVVIGENKTFGGNEDFLRQHGVEVVIADDPDCIALMERFIREKPDLWAEDIAED